MGREAIVQRKTNETEIQVRLNLDGNGISRIETDIPFLNHMLGLFSAHGFFDLELNAKGDTDIDYHHTIEDIGICIGKAIMNALKDKKGIKRYGEATVPMDEALARVVMDISNRPFISYRAKIKKSITGDFDVNLLQEFFRALAFNGGLTLHIDLFAGEDPHHVAEAIFKAFARALDMASRIEERLGNSVPSTKGVL